MTYRTHNCGELRISDVKKIVTLSGWVQKSRRLGGMVFIDIRDKKGITQVIFPAESKFSKKANSLRNEYVIKVSGEVVERKSKNLNMDTGEIEIFAKKLEVLSSAETTPLIIDDETDALEDVRMKYRYLDIRRNPVRKNLELRHKVISSIRNFFNDNDFIEVDTPTLTKATPEGARNFLVPSRLNKGNFYALPQSPQLFKQLLMIGGLERYYQIAKCFRDEDLRTDRQPEFTQLDIEASFLSKEEFQSLIEKMMQKVLKESKGINVKIPFNRISFEKAMTEYGSDKPDTRFNMKLNEVTNLFEKSEFKLFASAKTINVIMVEKILDKKQISKAEYIAKDYGAKGLAWVRVTNSDVVSPIAKFCKKELLEVCKKLKIKSDSTLLFVADKKETSQIALGAVRKFLGDMLELFDPNNHKLVWVEDWPLFELDNQGNYTSAHHPFTSPTEETKAIVSKEPMNTKAQAYDLVMNGHEIGGGSVRVFQKQLQTEIFKVLGLTEEQINSQFGFFINALKYGTPPHCGIAFGVDRIVMILSSDARSIKDVIAFPKNSSAVCTMSGAPSALSDEELVDLNIKVGE